MKTTLPIIFQFYPIKYLLLLLIFSLTPHHAPLLLESHLVPLPLINILCFLWFLFLQNAHSQTYCAMHLCTYTIRWWSPDFFSCWIYYLLQSLCLTKNWFPEFNCNMVVHEHPALIIDSMSLRYDIIFGVKFLDQCCITLNYDSNIV